MTFNLIMSSDPQHPLRFTKSSKACVLDIPYTMDNSSHLASYLEQAIPDDWNKALYDLHVQERNIIDQRKALMLKYKALSTIIFPPLIAQFKIAHPEHFI